MIWTLSRLVFFAWNTPNLPQALVLALYWIPFDLQFTVYSILVLFYAFLLYPPTHNSLRNIALYLCLAANIALITLTSVYVALDSAQGEHHALEIAHRCWSALGFAGLVAAYANISRNLWILAKKLEQRKPNAAENNSIWAVGFNPTLSSPSAAARLGSLSPKAVLVISSFFMTVFLSRFVFNLLNALDVWVLEIGGDFGGEKTVGPAAFFLFFYWEILPTAMLMYYFRDCSFRRLCRNCWPNGYHSSPRNASHATNRMGTQTTDSQDSAENDESPEVGPLLVQKEHEYDLEEESSFFPGYVSANRS
jgi:hypothetical protein